MSKLTEGSHLTVEQQQAKPYPNKKECVFCFAPYNTDLSDSLEPRIWCSMKCESIDRFIEDNHEV